MLIFLRMTRGPPGATPFPYTTLFRSRIARPRPALRCRARLMESSSEFTTEAGRILFLSRRSEFLRPDDWWWSGRFVEDRKSTRLNSSHGYISYAVFCLKKKQRQRHYQ